MGSTHRVTLIPGDGVGPELTEATRRVLEAAAATAGSSFDWDRQEAGVDNMETAGTPLPPAVLDSIRDTKVAIKGPITTPIGTGFRSVNVALRAELDLYACLRPCKTYPGVRSRFDHVDVVEPAAHAWVGLARPQAGVEVELGPQRHVDRPEAGPDRRCDRPLD